MSPALARSSCPLLFDPPTIYSQQMAHGRRLYINETELVSGTVGKHTVYHLDVRDGDEAWRVSKRFSEIREFRDVLVPKCSGACGDVLLFDWLLCLCLEKGG